MTQPASTVALLGAEAGTTDGALSDDGSQEHGEQRRQQGAASTSAADLAARGDPLSAEVRRVMYLAAPIVAAEMLSFVAYLITTAQAGRYGASSLSAFTLARTIFHITGLSLVVGLGSGADTFIGQMYGAGRVGIIGVYAQRGCAINVLVGSTIVACWCFFASDMMTLLGQDPAVILPARELLVLMSPSLICWSLVYPAHAYFAGQGVMTPLTVLSALGLCVTPIANHFFGQTLGLGIQGIALAYNVISAFDVLGLLACMVWLHTRQAPGAKSWSGLQPRAALSDWPAYLRIALPSMVMVCLDWWCFEVAVLIAGLQPEADISLAAMGVLFATHSLSYVLISGFGTAASTRTSNELGAGHGAAAKRATLVTVSTGFLLAVPIAAGLYAARTHWATLYTSDARVVDMISSCMLYLALAIVSDSANAVLSGVLRGSGHQALGSGINLVTLWGMGIPLCYWLGITQGLGGKGIWLGLASASVVQVLVLVTTMAAWDWDKQAARAKELTAQAHSPAPDLHRTNGTAGHHGVYEPLLAAPL